MKIDTFKQQTTETTVEGHGVMVTAVPWGNLEGLNFMIHEENGLSLRLAGSLRWEEVDVLMIALTTAR